MLAPVGVHGDAVGTQAGGLQFGLAQAAELVFTQCAKEWPLDNYPSEVYLERFLLVLDDIAGDPAKVGTSVVTAAFGLSPGGSPPHVAVTMRDLLRRFASFDAVVVVSSGNYGPGQNMLDHYPQSWALDPLLSDLIYVGATDVKGQVWSRSEHYGGDGGAGGSSPPPILVYAPGVQLPVPSQYYPDSWGYSDGTSLGTSPCFHAYLLYLTYPVLP